MARIFQRLTTSGWIATDPNALPRDLPTGGVFRILDSGVQQFKAPDMQFGDSGVYRLAQVAGGKVIFPVTTATGTEERTVAFTEGS